MIRPIRVARVNGHKLQVLLAAMQDVNQILRLIYITPPPYERGTREHYRDYGNRTPFICTSRQSVNPLPNRLGSVNLNKVMPINSLQNSTM